jgi:hypothetical protein
MTMLRHWRQSPKYAEGGESLRTWRCNVAAKDEPPLMNLVSVRRRLAAQVRNQSQEQLLREIREAAPELDNPRFHPVLKTFAAAVVLSRELQKNLAEKGLFHETGEVKFRTAATLLKNWSFIFKAAGALGLTPISLHNMGIERTRPVDLVEALARHSREIEDGEIETE